jgi:hypothetical protein
VGLINDKSVKSLLDLREHILLILVLKDLGGDDVLDLLFLPDWIDVEVVQDEAESALKLLHTLDLIVMSEGFSHDCNKHIEEMNKQKEGSKEEKNPKERGSVVVVTNRVVI